MKHYIRKAINQGNMRNLETMLLFKKCKGSFRPPQKIDFNLKIWYNKIENKQNPLFMGLKVIKSLFPDKPKRVAEHPAVNRRVVGSNPTRGAIFVVRKSYKTQKAQDLVCLVLFVTISCGSRPSRNI